MRVDRQSPLLEFLFVLLGTACASRGTPPAEGDPARPDPPPPARAEEPPPERPGLPPPGTFAPIQLGDPEGLAYDEPFFPGATHDPAVPPPEDFLGGTPVGSRLASPDEILAAFRAWDELSPRARTFPYGVTHEGRELLRTVITSRANHERLDVIRANLARLADPRGLSERDTERLVASTPAVAWLGYSIHGDETSGSDAALALAHHLIAGRDDDVQRLLDAVIVVIDPCMNPDGRARILGQLEQNAGYVTNLDFDGRHRGHWPYGRGNHYLFDMNRDWMSGVCPETRGRWAAARDLPPQLFVDAHEMSGLDTYLFYPQAEPRLPALPEKLLEWQGVFAADHARAFDRHGWGYYTREWADAWYVGYSDAWGSLGGAVGMLYEQARVAGVPLRRASGEVVSYRRAVHGHVVSSWQNLSTLAAHRAEILSDWAAARRRAVERSRPGGDRALFVVPGRHADREADWVETLLAQGIEVWTAPEGLVAREVVASSGGTHEQSEFPAGTWVVPAAQPEGARVEAYLGFDPRMPEEFLLEERRSLLRGEGSEIYDVTAWDLSRANDLDASWGRLDASPREAGFERLEAAPVLHGGPVGPGGEPAEDPEGAYALVVDGSLDRSVRFAARAMQLGLAVHLADEEFEAAGRSFPRGSLLLRRHENSSGFEERAARAAREARVPLFAADTGRSPGEGPDLGGGSFRLLEPPRVALVTGDPIDREAFGHVWHELDVNLALPATLIEAGSLGSTDLRRYNVLVLPPSRGLGARFETLAADLDTWVHSGGTLIAMSGSAAALCDPELGLTSAVLRRDALEDLDAYAFAAGREALARADAELPSDLWEPGLDDAEPSEPEPSPDVDELERLDEWARRFRPRGVILRGLVDREHWIHAGSGSELPVFYDGSAVLLTQEPVRAPVRLAAAEDLRLGGLLWPEARERIARSTWLAVERRGHGQVVLFASAPTFRGSFRAMARLFTNAVVFGPGAGADPPLGR